MAVPGIAHVILHVHGLGPAVRVIRLHTEGHLTMGGKKRAMEQLAEALRKVHRAKAHADSAISGQPACGFQRAGFSSIEPKVL